MSRVPQRVLRLDAEMAVPWMGFQALLLVSVTRVSLGAADGIPCQHLVAVLENDLEIISERLGVVRQQNGEAESADRRLLGIFGISCALAKGDAAAASAFFVDGDDELFPHSYSCRGERAKADVCTHGSRCG